MRACVSVPTCVFKVRLLCASYRKTHSYWSSSLFSRYTISSQFGNPSLFSLSLSFCISVRPGAWHPPGQLEARSGRSEVLKERVTFRGAISCLSHRCYWFSAPLSLSEIFRVHCEICSLMSRRVKVPLKWPLFGARDQSVSPSPAAANSRPLGFYSNTPQW